MSLASASLSVVASCLQPDAGGGAGRRLRARVTDWAKVLRKANGHLVVPAMRSILAEAGAMAELPGPVRDYLDFLHASNGERNKVVRAQAVEILRALHAEGVGAMLLKGGLALFDGPHSDPAGRIVGDIDVLVPAPQRAAAVRVLYDLGYRSLTRFPEGHHAYGDFARWPDPAAIDLHTELVDPAYVLPAAEVRGRAAAVAVHEITFLAPHPTDRVLHHLLHAQIHHLGNYYRGRFELRQLHWFAALARAYSAKIDWDFVVARLRRHRLETPLHSYLLLANRLLDLPWPLPQLGSRAAEFHFRRCLLQERAPALTWLAVPWGNMRGAFAWHRMRGLYGAAERLGIVRARHAWQFWRKAATRGVYGRLFRSQ